MKTFLISISLVSLLNITRGANTPSYAETILADAPITYWRLGEPAGSERAMDQIGDNYGVYENDPILGEVGACKEDLNSAVFFNGREKYVQARNPFHGTNIANFSIEFWMLTGTRGEGETTSAAYAGNGLVWSDVPEDANDFAINLLADKIAVWDGSFLGNDVDRTLVSTSSVTTGDWVYIVVTREAGRSMNIYINGAKDVSKPCGSAVLDANAALYLGSNLGDRRHYRGLLDEVANDKVLSTTEIAKHYNANGHPLILAASKLVASGENVALEWKADPTRRFRVLYKKSGNSPAWEDLETELMFNLEQASFSFINERAEGFYCIEAVNQ
jgi:hypothetical protein